MGAAWARAPTLSKERGTSGFVAPSFGQMKCSNFTICSYFVVKNILARFSPQLYFINIFQAYS